MLQESVADERAHLRSDPSRMAIDSPIEWTDATWNPVTGCDKVTVRFRPSRYVPPQRIGHDLTNRQRTVLAVLSAGGSGLALREVLARVSPRAQEWELKGDLAILKALGLVRSSGHGRGARWTLGGGPLA